MQVHFRGKRGEHVWPDRKQNGTNIERHGGRTRQALVTRRRDDKPRLELCDRETDPRQRRTYL